MRRPLVVTDCDEVLLHMVRHFRDWLGETHAIDFALNGDPFRQSFRRRDGGEELSDADKWQYLTQFFDAEMHRQTAIEGAAAALTELAREADVVVLTNLEDRYQLSRTRQLLEHGIDARVFTNQGPKGPALQRIVEEYAPSRAVFIDDIANHHASAAEIAPSVSRLHFCGEPGVAPHIPCAHRAGDAHARLDTWSEALPWILETLHGEP
ncbi:MAG TPA: HAD family hydrolase [Croceibacterium sp.]|nr:HAD family hydrolase [Croceibacterium sp.]